MTAPADLGELCPAHLDQLVRGSGISPEVIAERGYQTVYGAEALKAAGFAKSQWHGTGILIPLHAPDGSPAGYQYKPNVPRLKANGNPVKYEIPTGAGLRLDVPKRCQAMLANPEIPLDITEGVKKGDALASRGRCVVVLAGVWSFKGTNDFGGITFLADWDYITLKGRTVNIVFDSDVTTKREVKKALAAPLEETKEPNIQETPGFHLADGTLAEMIITPDGRAFAIHTAGDVKIMSEYRDGNVVYRPMGDNLAGQVVSFASGVASYGSLAQLLADVRGFVRRHVELPADYEAIASLYVLLTWVHDYLPAVPYLRALGDYGTGKSRFLEVLAAICFRAISAGGATSASPIFRIMDKYGGTLVMDEADYEKSDAQQEIIKILNSGYKPGSPVLKSEQVNGKNWEPRGYRVFGPKVIATRFRFRDKALESRCLTHETQGLTREDMPLVLGARFRAEAFSLRSKLLSFRLEHLPAMARLNLEDARPVGHLSPRLQEIILPMKALAQGDSELEKTLAEFVDAMQAQITAERRNSLPALVLEAILALHGEGSELSVKAIADRLNKEGSVKEHLKDPDKGITAKRVGGIIRGDLQLKVDRSPEEGSRRYVVQWEESRMARLKRRFCLSIPPNNVSDVSVPIQKFQPNVSVSAPMFQDVSADARFEQTQNETSETSETLKQGMETAYQEMLKEAVEYAWEVPSDA